MSRVIVDHVLCNYVTCSFIVTMYQVSKQKFILPFHHFEMTSDIAIVILYHFIKIVTQVTS